MFAFCRIPLSLSFAWKRHAWHPRSHPSPLCHLWTSSYLLSGGFPQGKYTARIAKSHSYHTTGQLVLAGQYVRVCVRARLYVWIETKQENILLFKCNFWPFFLDWLCVIPTQWSEMGSERPWQCYVRNTVLLLASSICIAHRFCSVLLCSQVSILSLL